MLNEFRRVLRYGLSVSKMEFKSRKTKYFVWNCLFFYPLITVIIIGSGPRYAAIVIGQAHGAQHHAP